MKTQQCTKSYSTSAIAIRFCPMSKTRMEWMRSKFPEFSPTRSMIIRRALKSYQQHLEEVLKDSDPTRLEFETMNLKVCGQGETTPWEHDPDFTQRSDMTLTELLKEFRTNRSKTDINRFLGSSPFKVKAARMVGAKP